MKKTKKKRTLMFQLKYDLSDLTETERKYIEEKIASNHLVDVENMAEAWAHHLMFKDANAETGLNISHSAVARKCGRLLQKAGYVTSTPDNRYSWTPVGVTSKAFDDVHPVKPDIAQICLAQCDVLKRSNPCPFIQFREMEVANQKYTLENPNEFTMVILKNYDGWSRRLSKDVEMLPFEGPGKHIYGVVLFDEDVLNAVEGIAIKALEEKALLFDDENNRAFSGAFDKVAKRVKGMPQFVRFRHTLKAVEDGYPFAELIEQQIKETESTITFQKDQLRRLKGFEKAYKAEFPNGAKKAIVRAVKKAVVETAPQSWYGGIHPETFIGLLKEMRKQEKAGKKNAKK